MYGYDFRASPGLFHPVPAMNYRILGIMAMIAILAVVAFYYQPPADEGAKMKVTEEHNTVLDVASGARTGPIPESVSRASNAFAVDLYSMLSRGEGNVLFSPMGIFAAFSLVYEGAEGDTAEQLEDAFGFEPDDILRASDVVRMVSTLKGPDGSVRAASSMWPPEESSLYDSYVSVVRDVYRAEIKTAEDGGDRIGEVSRWALAGTGGRVADLMPPGGADPGSGTILGSLVRVDGVWENQFPVESTSKGEFWNGTSYVPADFMALTGMFGHASDDLAQVIRMPYREDGISMLVVLPYGRGGIDSLEESLSVGMIERWRQDLVPENVNVHIPKIRMAAGHHLQQPLRSLGVADVFDGASSDLSGMGPAESGRIYVGAAVHGTYLEVNEYGTGGAAGSGGAAGAAPEPARKFVADHPFIILVLDEGSGSILLVGRVADPA